MAEVKLTKVIVIRPVIYNKKIHKVNSELVFNESIEEEAVMLKSLLQRKIVLPKAEFDKRLKEAMREISEEELAKRAIEKFLAPPKKGTPKEE